MGGVNTDQIPSKIYTIASRLLMPFLEARGKYEHIRVDEFTKKNANLAKKTYPTIRKVLGPYLATSSTCAITFRSLNNLMEDWDKEHLAYRPSPAQDSESQETIDLPLITVKTTTKRRRGGEAESESESAQSPFKNSLRPGSLPQPTPPNPTGSDIGLKSLADLTELVELRLEKVALSKRLRELTEEIVTLKDAQDDNAQSVHENARKASVADVRVKDLERDLEETKRCNQDTSKQLLASHNDITKSFDQIQGLVRIGQDVSENYFFAQ